MSTNKTKHFSLGVKVTDRSIDSITTAIYNYILESKNSGAKIVIDFSNVEWISNQELLVLTGLLKYLFNCKRRFEVRFLKDGVSSETIDKRKAKKLIEIWEVWKIYQVILDHKYDLYFDIDGRFIERLKQKHAIELDNLKIYNRYGVTPFVSLSKIDNYSDARVGEMLNSVYQLNQATLEILKKHRCDLPIASKTLSLIITKELYENFLDHFTTSFFECNVDEAFMSLSLKAKFDEAYYPKNAIQKFLKRNFEEEIIPEAIDFYYDRSSGSFKNQSVLQLSFLDFGEGIPKTLFKEYNKFQKTISSNEKQMGHLDSRILSYAFRYDSSRNPIDARYSRATAFPRGLFDLLSVVKRFEGLLVARSNYGKVLYDFSNNNSIENAVKYFDNQQTFFPGTLISIYIPERNSKSNLDTSVIKPYVNIGKVSFLNKQIKHVSLFEIQQAITQGSDGSAHLYNNLFKAVYREFSSNKQGTLVYLDFKGYQHDERITKKLIFFLISDYSINHFTSVIVLNPPPRDLLEEIKNEIIVLSEVVKDFYIHPTPFIYYDNESDDINIYWLGVFSEVDIRKLNRLLFEIHDLRKDDFENPIGVIGNVNYYDGFGNLKSLINTVQIRKLLQKEIIKANDGEIKSLITKHIKADENRVYLCNGNYYQTAYFELTDLLTDRKEFEYLCQSLYEKIVREVRELREFKVVAITSTSERILKYFFSSGIFEESKVVFLENYHTFQNEDALKSINEGERVILICDVISTGYMVAKFQECLFERKAELVHIAVFINGIDLDFEADKTNYSLITPKIISLLDYKMKKFRRREIKKSIIDNSLEIVRIDPYTNTLINQELPIKNSETILLSNQEFVDLVEDKHIKAGYYKFNNLIHPYFFDMDAILKDTLTSKRIIRKIFERIRPEIKKGIDLIFFPKNSGIRNLDPNFLKDEIFKNHDASIVELERFSTNEGWKFSHPPYYLNEVAKNKKVIIIDDGSCSGDSIIQMIDEVAFLDVQEIVLLSIIGRINEHKRDFFSRIKVIDSHHNEIKLTLLFGCHWHVPTYFIEESPILKEKRWLDELVKISNVPYRIRTIAENIRGELKLKDIGEDSNHYLLEKRDGSSIIKELILAKEEIGKITSFRFYKDYFVYFDKLVLIYDDNTQVIDRYKNIELVCAVFLHEPEVFEKVRNLLPDLVEKIEEFISAILFGNLSKVGAPRLSTSSLYYKWSTKNLFHLLFIVFKGKDLFDLLEVNRIVVLIKDFCKNETDLSYLFYRFLKSIPLNNDEISEKKFGGKVKHLMEGVAEYPKLERRFVSQLKIFSSFISTLPFDDLDFTSHLVRIKGNYSKITDDRFHNEYVFNDKQILVNQLPVLYKKVNEGLDVQSEVGNIKRAWSSISAFVEDLLKFAISYPGFFLPLDDKMSDSITSISYLRSIHSELRDVIYSDKFSDINRIRELVDYLFDNYIMEQSHYFKIFNSISTPEINKEFEFLLDELRNEYKELNLNISPPNNTAINFPKVYLTEIVFKEIKRNLRYADLSREIVFLWSEGTNSLTLRISNYITSIELLKGGGKGLNKLAKLNSFPIKTTYKSTSQKTSFVQNITFTKL